MSSYSYNTHHKKVKNHDRHNTRTVEGIPPLSSHSRFSISVTSANHLSTRLLTLASLDRLEVTLTPEHTVLLPSVSATVSGSDGESRLTEGLLPFAFEPRSTYVLYSIFPVRVL